MKTVTWAATALLATLLLSGCRSTEDRIRAADAAARRGNLREAAVLYRQAYERDPDHPLVRQRLSILEGGRRGGATEPRRPTFSSQPDGRGEDGGRRPEVDH